MPDETTSNPAPGGNGDSGNGDSHHSFWEWGQPPFFWFSCVVIFLNYSNSLRWAPGIFQS